jgi:uncharacterized radical SAM superfamily Fe-S cluster-containing enzyme
VDHARVNNNQVGPIVKLPGNPKITFISFQPVSYRSRRDHAERRHRQRYTLSHMASDVKAQAGITEPTRDWFPISLMGAFADFADLVHGPEKDWGSFSCGCHPNCGVGTAIMIHKETKEMVPVPQFINVPGLVKDLQKVTDAARNRTFSGAMMGLALLKNFQPLRAPSQLSLLDILKKFDKTWGVSGRNYGKSSPDRTMEDIQKRREDPWNFLFIAGMWFQDLFNYDSAAPEMCIILRHRKVRFRSALTTPAWAGVRSSRICTRMRPWRMVQEAREA